MRNPFARPAHMSVAVGLALAAAALGRAALSEPPKVDTPAADLKREYAEGVRPLVQKYCVGCHSTEALKGGLDLERFASHDAVRKDLKPWQASAEMVEAGEMPPKGKPQPTAAERKRITDWVRDVADAEGRARAGDPGSVPLRRLSNAEYDNTIRDLTGVDLKPTREFPADGAGGEGFANAAEALSDVSPALLDKYMAAAKEVAAHAVLLPDGLRFSPASTRREWSNEGVARLRAAYADFAPDGRLPVRPYLLATIKHRDALAAGTTTVEAVAKLEKLSPKYLGVLWQTLTDAAPSFPLDRVRAKWRKATPADADALAAEVAAWQEALWKSVRIGSYAPGASVRQVANDPAVVPKQALRLAVKPTPGQAEVTLHLAAQRVGGDKAGRVVWQRPRLEGAGKPPLLLRDYASFGPAAEFEFAALFANTAKYLAAVADPAADRAGLDAAFLKRWADVLALTPPGLGTGRAVAAVPLTLLNEAIAPDPARPAVAGWRPKGGELPVLLTNASDKVERVPATLAPHSVAAHPTPTEFVAAAWVSPVAGRVRVAAKVAHVHPACGNGVGWRVEQRRGERAAVLAEGVLDLGKSTQVEPRELTVEAGDLLMLAVDARGRDHTCDTTAIDLTVTELAAPNRSWNLAADVAADPRAGNPHADGHGNKDAWRFVRGPAGADVGAATPPASVLGRWREAALDPRRKADAARLAADAQALLAGPRPAEKHADRPLYDKLAAVDGPLLRGLDLARLGPVPAGRPGFGLAAGHFDADGNLATPADGVTAIRLPAALFVGREFVADCVPDPAAACAARVRVSTAADAPWDGNAPVVAPPSLAGQVSAGGDEFRRVFPRFVCFPHVIPVDEVVCLKMYHREDEPLIRLFLGDADTAKLDRLWAEHRFVSRWPVTEDDYLPQFIGYVTQDQPKEVLTYFEGQRGPFRARADQFRGELEAAVPKQLDALLDFAGRAYRRPPTDAERADLLALFRTLRGKGVSADEALRGVLARVLVSPAFLFKIERAPAGVAAGPVGDFELATRLSYFLWASAPDATLRDLAAAGKLRDPQVLAAQTRRMLADGKARGLAAEFGAQWLHVRGFEALKEKDEAAFPAFTAELRAALAEEAVLFFVDLFAADRPATHLLDADATFLNETLAKHYGIPGVAGPQWRRVEGVKKYGRGGVLGLGSVLAKQSGASRTSPTLRGNWVVETLLGEKLPRPPANVPALADAEGAEGLTTRQQVERHANDAACSVCHQRIDPFGFALENYDAIGRFRTKERGGHAVDTRATLKDGTAFAGADGLRDYLLTKKKAVVVRLFCRRLLGYALGRATDVSDQPLIDAMAAKLLADGGRVSDAVDLVVRSPQFTGVRGRDFVVEE